MPLQILTTPTMDDDDGELLSPNGIDSPVTVITTIDGKVTENGSTPADANKSPPEIRLYPTRFVMLFLFCAYSMSNSFQWIQYSIINNIICTYYDVSAISVNWTSVVYMVVYIPLIIPATWLLEKYGLRAAVITGSLGTCIGSWVKCLSGSPEQFTITMVGQTIVAMSQIFILGIPPQLAAVWFSDSEVSRACAVGVFGNQVGIALGFLIPPQVVPNVADKNIVGYHLRMMFYCVAGFTSLIFLLIIIFFREKPACPPSKAQAALADVSSTYWKSMMNLIRNKNYVVLLITYGINVGVFYAISTLLNQVILVHFPGKEEDAGWMGVTIVIAGMFGSVVCGFVLDKTHRFKETTLATYVFSLAGMIAFTFSLRTDILWVMFLISGFLGFFMTGYLPLGFEFAAEITYPESEGTSSGLLNASAQVFGIIFTMAGTWIFENYSDFPTNLTMVGALVLGAILTAFIRSDLRRRKAGQKQKEVPDNELLKA